MDVYEALASGTPFEATAKGVIERRDITDPNRGHRDAVAVVRTSGSTGTPKQTLLTASALSASAQATAERIGGQGQWVLAVGTQYVAGLAVVSRSVHAGTQPVVIDPGFRPDEFIAATRQLKHEFTAVSLVPTQLTRLLEHQDALAALQSYSAILVGGSAIPDSIMQAKQRYDLNLYTTYGMSETCGGCVYNGTPLPGMTVDTVEHNGVQRLRLTGPMVAAGYFDDPQLTATHFHNGSYLTDDYGAVGDVVQVHGRLDDVINTGGIKVSAAKVQQVLQRWVPEAFVTGIDDSHWGQRVCAVITGTTDQHILADTVRQELGAPAVPKTWLRVDALPMLENGKPDRLTLTHWLVKE
ncbi:AMP-binding protein [Yaniella halotolerans]|uniref:AMP-binding protein n=1 Tax=Yaniella halotolerans TaxID=225453 RepID=UPI0003B3EBC2|nr:AMP-binding protein [Yaniella halotolerans]